jgi:putative membrane protein
VPLVMAAAGYLSWLRAGHLFAEEALFVGSGLLGRRLWILPYEKLQTVSSSRTPLQRLLNLANVTPDTAGAARFGAPEVEDLPVPDARTLTARLLESFYAARARVRARSLAPR